MAGQTLYIFWMWISIHDLIQKYNIQLQGILHVGAHDCEELKDYEQYLGRDKILWIEAMPHKVESCQERYPNLLIEQAVVWDKVEPIRFKYMWI